MKLLHLGDLHLGRSLGDFNLKDDQAYILDQILQISMTEKVDGILIAGDVYDRAIPSEEAVNLLDHFLTDLAAEGIKVFMISGNHDSDDRLHFGSSLFEPRGIYISSIFNGTLQCRHAEDEYGPVNIWLLPFVKASQVRHFYPEEEILSYEDAVRVILKHAGIDPEQRNILIAHQFVTGGNTEPAGESAAASDNPLLAGSEGPAVQSVGLVEKISWHCFDDFDYVALGHIHAPQRIGRDQVRYCGSPLKYSLSEWRHDKSVPLITLGPKGQVSIDLHPLEPLRDLRHIRGPMEKLLAQENIQDTDDFLYVTLTDEDMTGDVMTIFQQYYPNTVKIDYDNSHMHEIAEGDFAEPSKGRSFDELIREFYEKIYGTEISEEELQIMNETAKEAGIL